MKQTLLLANFGGPRTLEEVEPFLVELLSDQELVPTPLPRFLHRFIFSRIAQRRVPYLKKSYSLIGGRSPIYEDTEFLSRELQKRLDRKVIAFHRYLPQTHDAFFEAISAEEDLLVLPLFPHYSFATTGSIEHLFKKNATSKNFTWIKSYATHPRFISLWQNKIKDFLKSQGLQESESILLFSAHSLPCSFIQRGDPYLNEIQESFSLISSSFPEALTQLSFQSRFGRGKWLSPDTGMACRRIGEWGGGRKHLLFIPISFTSDHIETLYEIDYLYFPLLEKRGVKPYRVPAFNRNPEWIDILVEFCEK